MACNLVRTRIYEIYKDFIVVLVLLIFGTEKDPIITIHLTEVFLPDPGDVLIVVSSCSPSTDTAINLIIDIAEGSRRYDMTILFKFLAGKIVESALRDYDIFTRHCSTL